MEQKNKINKNKWSEEHGKSFDWNGRESTRVLVKILLILN
jgi:hypothetical protein